jgi:hypothetical protein
MEKRARALLLPNFVDETSKNRGQKSGCRSLSRNIGNDQLKSSSISAHVDKVSAKAESYLMFPSQIEARVFAKASFKKPFLNRAGFGKLSQQARFFIFGLL